MKSYPLDFKEYFQRVLDAFGPAQCGKTMDWFQEHWSRDYQTAYTIRVARVAVALGHLSAGLKKTERTGHICAIQKKPLL